LVWQRLKAEWWLAKRKKQNDIVLCFGNLPPLFHLRGRTVVFIQNRYLIDLVSLESFPFKTRLRLKIERLWFSWKAGNTEFFIVQTPSMRAILDSSGLAARKPVFVLPFVDVSKGYRRSMKQILSQAEDRPFIYVASGEPHKNHRNLVRAWCLLAQEGLFPPLWLTLDADINSELCVWVDQQIRQFGLRLENLGAQPYEQIQLLYTQAKALIYPSTFESFGLPLIEARQAGIAVIASELDYVRDVLDPDQTFDPLSPASIARAVKRFMGASEEALPLLNAAEFVKSLMDKFK
jgi:glycosyltransferase involved in cell wall biosynthesis